MKKAGKEGTSGHVDRVVPVMGVSGAENGVNRRLFGISEKLSGLKKFSDDYSQLHQTNDTKEFAKAALNHLNIRYKLIDGDLGNVPDSGPVIFVCNSDFGGVESLILLDYLGKKRNDIKVLGYSFFGTIPELSECVIPVSSSGDLAIRKKENLNAARSAIAWLKSGGALVVFPSLESANNRWDAKIAKLIEVTKSAVVPVHISRDISMTSRLAKNVPSKLRNLFLPRNFLKQRNRDFQLWVGSRVQISRLRRFSDHDNIAQYLRLRSKMLMKHKYELSGDHSGSDGQNEDHFEEIIPPVPTELVCKGIDRIPKNQLLASSIDMDVYYASADQIPDVMREIGRLRETTFRPNGEGTGRSIDVDKFDEYYLQLFLWDRKNKKIAGGYRLGLTDQILENHGLKGFYSHSLFKLHSRFFKSLNPAIDVGRSFVCSEYQKNISSLLLLWKGIGGFVVRNPKYATLFGPVSMSQDYNNISHQLLIDFLNTDNIAHPLRKLIKPRTPFRRALKPVWKKGDLKGIGTFEGISELIALVEKDGKGAPVLIRHYLNLGGRILGFNIDTDFGDSVDGMVVVDLRETNVRTLGRYLTPEGVRSFRTFHGLNPDKNS